ncbi:MAG: hypothetical protein HC858_10985 [Brachymonas sp.]|nr:hypothetical protein [Brachymonas sp.]
MKHSLKLALVSAVLFGHVVFAQVSNSEGLPVMPMHRDGQSAQEVPSSAGMQSIAVDEDSKRLLALLRKKMPATTFTEVSKSPLEGVFIGSDGA